MNEVEYINGFSIALDESGTETVLVLQRNLPMMGDDDEFETETEVVGTLVMNSTVARNLGEALTELFSDDQSLV